MRVTPHAAAGRTTAAAAAAAAAAVVVVGIAALRTAGAMSCRNSWIEDETSYPIMGRVNVTGLGALADEYRRAAADGRPAEGGETAAAAVDVLLRMNLRSSISPRLNKACGYQLRVNGTAAAVSLSAYLPAYELAACGDGHVYRVQFVRAGGSHRQTVRLPDGVAVASVELRANGKNYLTIDSACVRLRGGGGGGARAFCVDLELLKSCWCLQAGGPRRPPTDYYLGFDGVSLAMSKWNVRDIVFHDVGALADGFAALARNASDVDARDAVCGRVELVPGELDAELDSCPVERRCATAATTAEAADDGNGNSGSANGGGGGGASFEFVPERLETNRLLYGCAPRPDDAAAIGARKNVTDGDHGAVDGRQGSGRSGAHATSRPMFTLCSALWFCASYRLNVNTFLSVSL